MRPDHGSVQFRGRVHPHGRLHRLAEEGLFYLPDRDLLTPGLSVREHLKSVARRWGRADADEVAGLTGIADRLDQRPPTLSSGERRRAELAVVLLRGPTCLLADEPYRGLGPYDMETVSDILRWRRGGAPSRSPAMRYPPSGESRTGSCGAPKGPPMTWAVRRRRQRIGGSARDISLRAEGLASF